MVDEQVIELKAKLQQARPPKRGDNSRGTLAVDAWRNGEQFIVLRGGWKLEGRRVVAGEVLDNLSGLNSDFVRALCENGQVLPKTVFDAGAGYKAKTNVWTEEIEPAVKRLEDARQAADKAQAYKAQAEQWLKQSLAMVSDAASEVRQAEEQLANVLASEPVKMAFSD